MNAVEIEDAISALAAQPFDSAEFPFAFLAAFDNPATTIKRLRAGNTNRSDVPGGVLQRNKIHIAVCEPGTVGATLKALRDSPETAKAKAKFVLATDGETLEAEDLAGGDTIACDYPDFANHFGFFLSLAGISTVREIKENPIDIKATGRLNKLYIELLKHNRDWAGADRRHDMNHFMARLIFCFFAEDTNIFNGAGMFTQTIDRMSERDGGNVHEVMGTVFGAMDVKPDERDKAGLPAWAAQFPYVNGSLFAGSTEVPRFTRLARSYLVHAGELDWKTINPDIFGSMIQAVADDEERGALGMHYTSVPNILKVLNPLFLDDLNAQLEAAGDNKVKLLNLRKRMARIRVFDPACGSGNFLVIAYKRMRAIEAKINERRGEAERKSDLPLTNFRGIELRDFSAEIARLALVIAEYQCDVLYRGQQEALKDVLPLKRDNWITCGNALRLDWLTICPPTGTGVKVKADDLFETPLNQAEIDFENEGGEMYICGNPPYSGKGKKEKQQLDDMDRVFAKHTNKYGYVDYVGCWFVLAAGYCRSTDAVAAFVATNSICQGRQLPQLWPLVFAAGNQIAFAHLSFKWSNNAAHNAGVTCVIVGIAPSSKHYRKTIFSDDHARDVTNINAYLVDGPDLFVRSQPNSLTSFLPQLVTGSVPNDGGNLILGHDEVGTLIKQFPAAQRFVHPFFGSHDYLQGDTRYCLVIPDQDAARARDIPPIAARLKRIAALRAQSPKKETRDELALVPHRFQHCGAIPTESTIIVPSVSSERREWFPAGLLPAGTVISNLAFLIADAPLWALALATSRLHLVWIATVCGKLKTDFRYSNTLGWNTFPVPTLTEQNKADLTHCAEEILLAREHYFPATIADMYDPERMGTEFPLVREAHERNDEVLERIYIGRRFKNDTERLEKLFDLYTKMTAAETKASGTRRKRR